MNGGNEERDPAEEGSHRNEDPPRPTKLSEISNQSQDPEAARSIIKNKSRISERKKNSDLQPLIISTVRRRFSIEAEGAGRRRLLAVEGWAAAAAENDAVRGSVTSGVR